MSFLGGLFGLSSPQPEQQESSASAELFNQTNFRSTVTPSSPAAPELDANVAAAAPAAPEAPSSLAMLKGSYDATALHPMAQLGDKLDFLDIEEDKLSDLDGGASVLPSRGWTDDLCVGTGTTYLSGAFFGASAQAEDCLFTDSVTNFSGLIIGGAWGFKEGVSRPLGANASFRLRLNNILNSCTRRGSFTGNSLGVLGE